MNTMYIATMSTDHFDWTAAGHTPDEARQALLGAFNASAANLGGQPFANADELAEWYGITVLPIAPGVVYRDHSLLAGEVSA